MGIPTNILNTFFGVLYAHSRDASASLKKAGASLNGLGQMVLDVLTPNNKENEYDK